MYGLRRLPPVTIPPDNRGMIGLVQPGVDVGWSGVEPFGSAESVGSVREVPVTREIDLVL